MEETSFETVHFTPEDVYLCLHIYMYVKLEI